MTFSADDLNFDGTVLALGIGCWDSDADEHYGIERNSRFLTVLGPALGMKVPNESTENIR